MTMMEAESQSDLRSLSSFCVFLSKENRMEMNIKTTLTTESNGTFTFLLTLSRLSIVGDGRERACRLQSMRKAWQDNEKKKERSEQFWRIPFKFQETCL